MKRIVLFSILLFAAFSTLTAQDVYENHQSEIYNYLARLAQKGIIRFDDQIRPLSRTYLLNCLDSVSAKTSKLSSLEKSELAFYLQEFNAQRFNKATENGNPVFLKKDAVGRWRMLYAKSNTASLYFDPLITGGQVSGSNKNYNYRSTGIHFWGTIGKHIGFQMEYNDVLEKGVGFDSLKIDGSETGIVRKSVSNVKDLNYSEFRGSINYSFKNGSIAVGQDHLLYGYGENGRIILSDKAPNFPFVRLDYQIFPWLHFNYTHAWLNSNIIDSNVSYNTGNLVVLKREAYIPKFMATHSVQINLRKGLDFSFGESIIYSDKLNIGYLFPIMPFKIYDNLINNNTLETGSNSQLFLTISSRNQLKNTHLYGNLFIDEIRLSTIFDPKKSRNQIGYTFGANITDFPIHYLSLIAEYTRINPFVYNNVIPTQTYTHDNYYLGDWMGNNADRLILSMKYTPIHKLKLMARYQTIRKGSAGTIVDQYLLEPQPPFLFGTVTTRNELYFSANYELIHGLNFNGYYSKWNDIGTTYSLGMSYGL